MQDARIVVRQQTVRALRSFISDHATLYAAAAAAPGRLPLTGRVPAYCVQVGDEKWLVRHYHRGGFIERFLGDRYLRTGGSRSLRELHVSETARARGIATPKVIAAAQYGDGLFIRFDIAVEYVEHAYDLAEWLFSREPNSNVVGNTARIIRQMIAAHFMHPDLNLKNILASDDAAWIIDLDRCVLRDFPRKSDAIWMKQRFLRSLEKWQARAGKRVAPEVRQQLEEAFSA